ncbi:hypothetical protein HDU77_007185 [Chytriomyces hyalinus]|nr:hypothetical protein HDU77_007185 [Chytriomyces hyalinus]
MLSGFDPEDESSDRERVAMSSTPHASLKQLSQAGRTEETTPCSQMLRDISVSAIAKSTGVDADDSEIFNWNSASQSSSSMHLNNASNSVSNAAFFRSLAQASSSSKMLDFGIENESPPFGIDSDFPRDSALLDTDDSVFGSSSTAKSSLLFTAASSSSVSKIAHFAPAAAAKVPSQSIPSDPSSLNESSKSHATFPLGTASAEKNSVKSIKATDVRPKKPAAAAPTPPVSGISPIPSLSSKIPLPKSHLPVPKSLIAGSSSVHDQRQEHTRTASLTNPASKPATPANSTTISEVREETPLPRPIEQAEDSFTSDAPAFQNSVSFIQTSTPAAKVHKPTPSNITADAVVTPNTAYLNAILHTPVDVAGSAKAQRRSSIPLPASDAENSGLSLLASVLLDSVALLHSTPFPVTGLDEFSQDVSVNDVENSMVEEQISTSNVQINESAASVALETKSFSSVKVADTAVPKPANEVPHADVHSANVHIDSFGESDLDVQTEMVDVVVVSSTKESSASQDDNTTDEATTPVVELRGIETEKIVSEIDAIDEEIEVVPTSVLDLPAVSPFDGFAESTEENIPLEGEAFVDQGQSIAHVIASDLAEPRNQNVPHQQTPETKELPNWSAGLFGSIFGGPSGQNVKTAAGSSGKKSSQQQQQQQSGPRGSSSPSKTGQSSTAQKPNGKSVSNRGNGANDDEEDEEKARKGANQHESNSGHRVPSVTPAKQTSSKSVAQLDSRFSGVDALIKTVAENNAASNILIPCADETWEDVQDRLLFEFNVALAKVWQAVEKDKMDETARQCELDDLQAKLVEKIEIEKAARTELASLKSTLEQSRLDVARFKTENRELIDLAKEGKSLEEKKKTSPSQHSWAYSIGKWIRRATLLAFVVVCFYLSGCMLLWWIYGIPDESKYRMAFSDLEQERRRTLTQTIVRVIDLFYEYYVGLENYRIGDGGEWRTGGAREGSYSLM